MRNRGRALLLFLLPALGLLGLPAATAASSPSPDLKPGTYVGTVNMTAMHSGSVTVTGASTEWSVDMVGSVGQIDIGILPLGSWAIVVDVPVPIDYHSSASISDKASKCKGYTVTGSAYGRAQGSSHQVGDTPAGEFTLDRLDWALSSMSARIKKDGECPSDTWGPEARTAVNANFAAIFGSPWTFTVVSATDRSLAGTCSTAVFGYAKGQVLTCDWRAYWIPSK